METNELRDFAQRAPKAMKFDGWRIISGERVRQGWLAEMSAGTIDERINRRAGLRVPTPPFYAPWRGVRASIQRQVRRKLQRAGCRGFCHAHKAC